MVVVVPVLPPEAGTTRRRSDEIKRRYNKQERCKNNKEKTMEKKVQKILIFNA